MELSQLAGYFDRQDFDTFTPAGDWQLAAFKGQLKVSDYFTALWHRSTRRRVLTVVPGQEPDSYVIRVNGLAEEVYLVGAEVRDSNYNTHYRTLYTTHKAKGLASIIRRAPTGPANNPGWDQDTVIQQNYADVELRTQQNDPELEYDFHGNYYIFLPADAPVQNQDYVLLDGTEYFVEEPYFDAGFLVCRVNDEPDKRVNFVYHKKTGSGFDTETNKPAPTFNNYNVTGFFSGISTEDEDDKTFMVDLSFKLIILDQNISVEPELNDEVTFEGRRYEIASVRRDPLKKEWHLEARR